MALKELQKYPDYDPDKHYRGNELVYAECLCVCGGVLRIRGEVGTPAVVQNGRIVASGSNVAESFRAFWERHSGVGHAPTSDKVQVAQARERLRYEAFVTARENPKVEDVPEDMQYIPTDWDAKNFGVTSEAVLGGVLEEIEDRESQYFGRQGGDSK